MPDLMGRIDVVATVVYSGDKVLTVYNPHWGAFTLPQTKLRNPQLGLDGAATRWERGAEAAMRTVGEFLGVTSLQTPGLLLDIGSLQQSDRSGQINHYQFQVYGVPVEGQQVAPGVAGQWLTSQEILDKNRSPISPTARQLVAKLTEAALERGGKFPPAPAAAPRTSVASIAIIRQQQKGQAVWLCQWNPKWGRYFLIGGHQKPSEAPPACMARELGEELRLRAGDYQSQVRRVPPAQPLSLVQWSASAWQTTNYQISCFDVTLNDDVTTAINQDAANRWLTAIEIREERCSDGKLVSPTARKILRILGEI